MKREFQVGELAKILNVARSTVITWIKNGEIEAYQLPGGINRIPRESLTAFMKQYGIPVSFLDEYTVTRILVVDDEEDILKMLKERIELEPDFRVRTAATGYDAGYLTRDFRPHIIILDINLTDIDGREVAAKIRASDDLPNTKIIAISGKISKEEEKRLWSQGFDGYFQKPFKLNEFIETLSRLI